MARTRSSVWVLEYRHPKERWRFLGAHPGIRDAREHMERLALQDESGTAYRIHVYDRRPERKGA